MELQGPSHVTEVTKIYEALKSADVPLLRGVYCYLKAHLLWPHPFFKEEMGINLYIALEGGLRIIRKTLIVLRRT